MGHRLDLHYMLVDLLGSSEVYYQPPESIKMNYPSIVYFIETMPTQHADDMPYIVSERYLVTYITRNPDDDLTSDLCSVPGFKFERHYGADNLHHYVYTYTFN